MYSVLVLVLEEIWKSHFARLHSKKEAASGIRRLYVVCCSDEYRKTVSSFAFKHFVYSLPAPSCALYSTYTQWGVVPETPRIPRSIPVAELPTSS